MQQVAFEAWELSYNSSHTGYDPGHCMYSHPPKPDSTHHSLRKEIEDRRPICLLQTQAPDDVFHLYHVGDLILECIVDGLIIVQSKISAVGCDEVSLTLPVATREPLAGGRSPLVELTMVCVSRRPPCLDLMKLTEFLMVWTRDRSTRRMAGIQAPVKISQC